MRYSAATLQTSYASPLGRIILAASGGKLLGAWFDGQSHQPDTSRWPEAGDAAIFDLAQTQISDYFAGRRQSFDLPLDLSGGTDFQQATWRALLQIPFAVTLSYGALSVAIGRPSAVRAVAGAVARNPLSIIVPCHRVLGTKGALTGYAGGIERKRALLQLEGARFAPTTRTDPSQGTL